MASAAPDRLISADKVKGTEVYNASGDKLGSINGVMIDKQSGKVAYADMSFGGFLGLGDRNHPLPWGVLPYSDKKGGYVVDPDTNGSATCRETVWQYVGVWGAGGAN